MTKAEVMKLINSGKTVTGKVRDLKDMFIYSGLYLNNDERISKDELEKYLDNNAYIEIIEKYDNDGYQEYTICKYFLVVEL